MRRRITGGAAGIGFSSPGESDRIGGMSHPTRQSADRPRWAPFWGLTLIQAQNSFNEKGVQFLLIPLGVWLAEQGSGTGDLKYPLSALILLPFILFSPLAGWLSDRCCKTRVIQAMAAVQILVLGGMSWCLRHDSLGGALAWFSLFCVQATFFSPSKKGLVKDLVGTKHLGFASGVIEMGSLLALLAGQIGVFAWFHHLRETGNDGWAAAALPCTAFFLCTLPTALLTLFLPRYMPLSRKPFSASLLYAHFSQLKLLWERRTLRISEAGVGYFWFIGGAVLLMTLQTAEQHTQNDTDFAWVSAQLMACLSGGSVLGGLSASLLCRGSIGRRIPLIGGAGMTLGCLALALAPYGTALFYAGLAFTGFTASAFLVPLNALLQDSADNDRRGDVIAAGNLVDCLTGLLAVGVQWLMAQAMPPAGQFVVMAALSAAVTRYVVSRTPGRDGRS